MGSTLNFVVPCVMSCCIPVYWRHVTASCVMSCHIVSCHAITAFRLFLLSSLLALCRVVSWLVLSCSCPVVFMSNHVVSGQAKLRQGKSRQSKARQVRSGDACSPVMSCRVMYSSTWFESRQITAPSRQRTDRFVDRNYLSSRLHP